MPTSTKYNQVYGELLAPYGDEYPWAFSVVTMSSLNCDTRELVTFKTPQTLTNYGTAIHSDYKPVLIHVTVLPRLVATRLNAAAPAFNPAPVPVPAPGPDIASVNIQQNAAQQQIGPNEFGSPPRMAPRKKLLAEVEAVAVGGGQFKWEIEGDCSDVVPSEIGHCCRTHEMLKLITPPLTIAVTGGSFKWPTGGTCDVFV